jgi:hypothetical protein
MRTGRIRIRQKIPGAPIVSDKTPEHTKRLSAAARERILHGIDMLTEAVELKTLESVSDCVLTMDGFIKWKNVGRDTLYTTNGDLVKRLNSVLKDARGLKRPPKNGKLSRIRSQSSQLVREQAKVRELNKLLEARDQDVFQLIGSVEELRRQLAEAEQARRAAVIGFPR